MSLDKKFAKWKGIDRTEIDWAPEIDEDKCVGCGMCVTSCGRNVFDYDWDQKKAVTASPLQCMVGCTSCQTWCIYDAISFPNPDYVKELIKNKNVLAGVKKELKERK
ncbi:MAG: 4Fe-4S ferredoxin [Halanaerobium sp. T82-1]|nr:MAG: 4Fe-4S ferredoxin [Halanaerobium sp. T82-1]